jgi:hypothetical protein
MQTTDPFFVLIQSFITFIGDFLRQLLAAFLF